MDLLFEYIRYGTPVIIAMVVTCCLMWRLHRVYEWSLIWTSAVSLIAGFLVGVFVNLSIISYQSGNFAGTVVMGCVAIFETTFPLWCAKYLKKRQA